MAVQDIRSNIKQNIALTVPVTGNGTTNGFAIDTADFELGLMFNVLVSNFTDGSYTFTLEESDDSAFTSPVLTVPSKTNGLSVLPPGGCSKRLSTFALPIIYSPFRFEIYIFSVFLLFQDLPCLQFQVQVQL